MTAETPEVVFRPRRLLFWSIVFSAAAVVGSVGTWIGLGPHVRALFTPLQVVTLLVFLAFSVGLIMSLGLCMVRATPAELSWRNGVRSHRLPWSDVRGIQFRAGDPWAYVVVHDEDGEPSRHQLMGIQSTDREAAFDKADQLRELWRRYR